MRKLAAWVLLAAAGAYTPFASAFTDPNGVFSSYTGGKTTISPPVTNPNWTATVSGSNIRAGTTATVAARNGKTVAVPIGKVLAPSAARKMMSVALRGVPLVGTGIVLWELYNAFGVNRDAQGNLDYDAGVPTVPIQTPCWKGPSHTTCFTTADAAALQRVKDIWPASGGYSGWSATWNRDGWNSNIKYYNTHVCANPSCSIQYNFTDYVEVTNTPTTVQGCQNGSAVRRDGKCSGGTVEQDITDDQAGDKLMLGNTPTSLAEMAAGLESAFDWSVFQLDKPMDVGTVPSVNVGNTVQVTGNPPVTTTITETDNGVNDGDGDIDWTTTTNDGTTETTEPADKEKGLDPCGLPTTPPCVIDEGKTPKSETLTDAAKASADAQKARIDAITTVTQSSGKQTSWAWNLATPTNCTSLAVDMRYGSIGRVVTLNPCAYQSVFHDLMSMAWAAATLFLVFGMVGRTLREV